MDDARVRTVTRRSFQREDGVLEGYARILPRHGYPYIVQRAGSEVPGSVLLDVDPESLERLDRYEDEGHLYVRALVEVRCGARRLQCHTYLGNVSVLAERFPT